MKETYGNNGLLFILLLLHRLKSLYFLSLFRGPLSIFDHEVNYVLELNHPGSWSTHNIGPKDLFWLISWYQTNYIIHWMTSPWIHDITFLSAQSCNSIYISQINNQLMKRLNDACANYWPVALDPVQTLPTSEYDWSSWG